MSGGEQQMLALARAMMSRPKLMLLDEASPRPGALVTRQFFDQLKELNTQEDDRARGRAERQPGPRRGAPSYVLEAGHIAVSVGRRAARRRGRPQGLPRVLEEAAVELFIEQLLNGIGFGVVYGSWPSPWS